MDYSLGSLLGEMGNHGAARPSPVDGGSHISEEEIKTKFSKLMSSLSANHSNYAEIEARIGVVESRQDGNHKFTPGVSERDFHALRIFLGQDQGFQVTSVCDLDYLYSGETPGTNSRVTYALDQQQVQVLVEQGEVGLFQRLGDPPQSQLVKGMSSMLKQKLYSVEFSTQREYDCRINLSTEVVTPAPKSFLSGYGSKRLKIRQSYFRPGNIWKAEVSTVYSEAAGGRLVISYEVELELTKEAVRAVLHESIRDRKAVQFFKTVEFFCQPNNWHKYASLSAYLNSHQKEEGVFGRTLDFRSAMTIRNELNGIMGVAMGAPFPGTLPMTLRRSHLFEIAGNRNDYYVSEKSDGLRYLLLAKKEGVYLIERSSRVAFLSADDCPALSRVLSHGALISLLDGEMVRHLDGHYVFMIFDVILYMGNLVRETDLNVRLSYVKTIIEAYRGVTSENDPFILMGKSFYPVRHVDRLFHKIHKDNGEYVFDDKSKRRHLTDGLVFTRISPPYPTYTTPAVVKWKFPDLLTVDFRLHPCDNNHDFELRCLAGRGKAASEVLCNLATLSSEEVVQIKKECEQKSVAYVGCIAELRFDRKAGKWSFYKIRNDKDRPNHIKVILDTLLVSCENISQQELIQTLTPSS